MLQQILINQERIEKRITILENKIKNKKTSVSNKNGWCY